MNTSFNLTDDEVIYILNITKTSKNVHLIGSIILVIIGIICNFLTFLIYIQRKYRLLAMGRYLACLAVFDILVTISLMFKLFTFEWTKTTIFCKIFLHLRYTNIQFCAWLSVINSFDRSLAVLFAMKSSYRCFKIINLFQMNTKYQLISLGIILISLLAINAPLSVYAEYSSQIGGCGLPKNIGFIVDIIDLLVSTIIPFILMLFSSILIIRKLYKTKNHLLRHAAIEVSIVQQQIQTGTSTSNILQQQQQQQNRRFSIASTFNLNSNSSGRDKQFAQTVIGINLLFLICNLPICIVLIIWNYFTYTGKITILMDSQLKLAYVIFLIFMHTYNAAPLFVYLSCNKLFRKDFLAYASNCYSFLMKKIKKGTE